MKRVLIALVLFALIATGVFAQVTLAGSYVLKYLTDNTSTELELRLIESGDIIGFDKGTNRAMVGRTYVIANVTYVVITRYGVTSMAVLYGKVEGNKVTGTTTNLVSGKTQGFVLEPK